MRVVHHRDGLFGGVGEAAGGEVVGEAEGVAGLMRGELAGALEDHREHGIACRREWLAVDVGAEEGLVDEIVLAAAEGAEGDVALDDFAGAGIHYSGAVAPATGVTVDPLDHVVADVHGVGAGGQDVSLEGAFGPACGLEGLVPPACAFEECGADRLGGAAVDVVLDRRDCFAIFLQEGSFLTRRWRMMNCWSSDSLTGHVVVAIGGGEVACARVEAAWREAGAGEFDEGLVFADGEGVGVGA